MAPGTTRASPQQQVAWLATPLGHQWLSTRPFIQRLYETGELHQLMYRADWPEMAERWRARASLTVPFDHSVTLSEEEKLRFLQDGYITVRGVVPQQLVTAALRVINNCIGYGGSTIAPDTTGKTDLAGGITNDPDVLSLFYNSAVSTYAQLLLGTGRVAPVRAAQIALRYPTLWGAPASIGGRQYHIDGVGRGKHSPFSLLIGVALSAQPESMCGNFGAYPGSHFDLQDIMKRAVAQDSGLGLSDEFETSKPSLGEAVQVNMRTALYMIQTGVKINVRQVVLQPGDIILAHQKLAHCGAPNCSPHIRYQVYFRVSHVQHDQLKDLALDNIWLEYEAMETILAADSNPGHESTATLG
jgi:hypothetical protein